MEIAVGAIVLDVGPPLRILLVRRGKPPRALAWTIPGGHLEPGETLAEAIRREVKEETSLDVRVVEETEVVELTGEGFHYRIHEHLCLPMDRGASPVPGDDACEARWVGPEELERLGVTAEARAVIARAAKRLGLVVKEGS
jgi:ADP-ribose pyrophosphatase YjhB (NUDIX family)